VERVAKPAGEYNIVIEEVDIPKISDTEVLIKAERTLIMSGAEIRRRYIRPEAIAPSFMGFSLAGKVVEVGAKVTGFSPGDRVAASAPHSEYVAVEVGEHPSEVIVRLPPKVSAEAATFWPLATGGVMWMRETEARDGDTVVILGQGLVGSCCMQAVKAQARIRVIAVDTLAPRCKLARELGADEAVNAAEEDPVAAVKRLTGGEGAEVVVYAVGGRGGGKAFAQGQDMLKRGGLLKLIGIYEDEPLPLDSGKIQGRRLQGGYQDMSKRPEGSARAIQLLADGKINAARMISHRFPFQEAAAAFDLLYNRLSEAMGVILVFE